MRGGFFVIRSRGIKRKEHLGLVWSPIAKKFVQSDSSSSKSEVSTPIYHAQAEFSLVKEIDGLPRSIGLEDVGEADVSLESQGRWKESLKKLTKRESVFQRGISVLESLESSKIARRPKFSNIETEKQADPRLERVRTDLPGWAKSKKNRKQLRFSPSRLIGQRPIGSQFSRLRQADWTLLKGIYWPAVAWGWVIALSITIAVLGAAALYVAFTPGSVYYLSTYLMLNKVVSPLFGGIVAGWKVNRKGWQTGLWVGLGYGLAIMIFRLYGGLLSAFWLEAVTGLAVSILAGIIGGAMGRGLAPERRVARSAA